MGKKFKDYFKTPGGIGKFGIYTAIIGITTGWLIFPYALDYLLGKRLALVEGTEARDLWTKLPPLVTSIYLFNITNPNEVQNGAKPIVEEIGPYCYLAYKEKVNLVDDEEDDTVSYTGKSTWYKLPPSPDDYKKTGAVCHQTLTGNEIIVQPNAFLMAILLKARNDFPAPLLSFVNAALPGIWGRLTNVFLRATAYELIFDGILINCTSNVLLPRVICVAVEQNSKALVTLAKNIYLFSFFGGQNGTMNEYRLTVKRGRKDLMDVGRITQIDGNTELPFWKGECNKIYGTDSTIFPPHRRRDNASFTAYISELCRVVKGTYVGDAVVNGIKGHEYIVTLGKGGVDPITRCYCSKPKKCPPGAVDITPCMGAPLTATFPHFYDAPEFQNDVIGLNPDRTKHATYGILEEASGVPLQGRRRVQINIELKKIPYVGVTSKLKGYMCPLLWIEEAFDLEGDLLSMVKYQLVLGLTAMSAVKWGLLILGAGLSVFGGVGKYMNGPNWKKMTQNAGGVSPRNPSGGQNSSKLEEGNKYQKFQNEKTDPTSRSIMFYKEKFRKTDTSMQTEPLFYAVNNGRLLQPQKSEIENNTKQRQEAQTIIPLFTDEVDPDSQSQPFQESKHNLKTRLDSPESVDQRFPLLNIIHEDVVSYPVVKSNRPNIVLSDVDKRRTLQVDSGKGTTEAHVDSKLIPNAENIETLEVHSRKSRTEAQDDSKLRMEIRKLNARLNILERMKENLSRASVENAAVRKREDMGENHLNNASKLDRKYDIEGGNSLKLAKKAEDLRIDKKLFIPKEGRAMDDALETKNLKLEEEARKLRVELNVLKGLRNGQFPLRNNRRDDWAQTDDSSVISPNRDDMINDVRSDDFAKGVIKKTIYSNLNSHSDVSPRPSVRFQHKIDTNDLKIGVQNIVQKSVKSDGDQLNSREKFFGRQSGTDVQNVEGNVGKGKEMKPEVSDGLELEGGIPLNNLLSKIQRDPTLKMTLHDSMQMSGSRNFENEVLKVLRGEVRSQMRGDENLGVGIGKVPQRLLETMEKINSPSRNISEDMGPMGRTNFPLKDIEKQMPAIQGVEEPTKMAKDVEKYSNRAENSGEFSKVKDFKGKVTNESELLRQKYYNQLSAREPSSKRRKIQVSSSTEDSSDQIATEETTLDEDSNMEELEEQLRKLSPETEKEEKDKLPDLKKVKIKKNWKKVLTIVHTSRQIYNYRQLEKRQLFGESVEDYREDQNLEGMVGDEEEKTEDEGQSEAVRKVSTRTSSMDTDSIEDFDSLSRSIENTPSLSRSVENTPSMTRRRPSLKYLERVASIDSLLDSEGLSDARITVTGAFSGGILRRRLSRESSLSDNDNV